PARRPPPAPAAAPPAARRAATTTAHCRPAAPTAAGSAGRRPGGKRAVGSWRGGSDRGHRRGLSLNPPRPWSARPLRLRRMDVQAGRLAPLPGTPTTTAAGAPAAVLY